MSLLKMSDVYIDASRYEREHGKHPRGAGNWGFCPRSHYDDGDYLKHVVWINGHFAQAKRAAREHFASAGVADVMVCA